MQKLLTGLAVAAAFAVSAAASQACDFHASQVTASAPSEEVVAMSSVKDATAPVVITADQTCPAGQANCVPAGK
jgi:hypothetical protein